MNKREMEICTQIYEANKKRLNWYMWKYFHWMNEEDVHDVMQDTWRILGKNIRKVGTWSEREQWVWLMTVCHNRAVSVGRKQERFVDWEERFQKQVNESVEIISVEDEVIDKVMAEALLSKLTTKDKEFLMKKYSSDSSMEEKTKTNAEVCKTYRLRRKLEKLWEEFC